MAALSLKKPIICAGSYMYLMIMHSIVTISHVQVCHTYTMYTLSMVNVQTPAQWLRVYTASALTVSSAKLRSLNSRVTSVNNAQSAGAQVCNRAKLAGEGPAAICRVTSPLHGTGDVSFAECPAGTVWQHAHTASVKR